MLVFQAQQAGNEIACQSNFYGIPGTGQQECMRQAVIAQAIRKFGVNRFQPWINHDPIRSCNTASICDQTSSMLLAASITANRSGAEKVKVLKAELAEKKRTQLELKRRKQGDYAVIRQTYEFKQAELKKRLAEMRERARMASMKGRSSDQGD